MPSPCQPAPIVPVLPLDEDFGRPLLGCGLAGVRELASYLGPPSYAVPKVTTAPSNPGAVGAAGLTASSASSG